MTERLYYHDATLTSFDAVVVALEEGGSRVYLDRTAFYPTSGGQPHDLGRLAGVAVTDVVDEEERIAHVLEAPLSAHSSGEPVAGEVDWTRRHDLMQQHTGQHLLSAVCAELLGARTVSVHFGSESSTVDFALDEGRGARAELPEVTLAAIERRANDIVGEARSVVVTFEEAAGATGLRKESRRGGTLRIVSIEGIDRSACGGTHVSCTSEIGPVILRRQERVRDALRIEFLCGHRAMARARQDYQQLSRIARLHSSSIDDVASVVESQASQLRDLESSQRRLQEQLATARADALYHGTQPGPGGLRTIVERRDTGGADASRQVALAITRHPRAVFIAASESPPTVLLATSEDSGVDAAGTLRPLLQRGGGRGGGSPRLAQGSLPGADSLGALLDELERAGGRGPAPTSTAHES
jgi:alanyl-tRNA synthetase